MKQVYPIVLASGSPRRKELMQMLGLSFETDVSQADEHFAGTPKETVAVLSQRKAAAVAPAHPSAIILAADTLVFVDSDRLGKPKDRDDARHMLQQLSGRWHSVLTGVTVCNTKTGRSLTEVEETKVHFLDISEEEMEAYLSTDEPYDKAGAYAIQGRAGVFIDRIDGSWSNVVGLPMHTAKRLIEALSEG
ncbi:MAG: septum formation inhibitor Maf [Clostridia bacterium]|nr:septum formation inhibitor Maf [Clostridia bacterium]